MPYGSRVFEKRPTKAWKIICLCPFSTQPANGLRLDRSFYAEIMPKIRFNRSKNWNSNALYSSFSNFTPINPRVFVSEDRKMNVIIETRHRKHFLTVSFGFIFETTKKKM